MLKYELIENAFDIESNHNDIDIYYIEIEKYIDLYLSIYLFLHSINIELFYILHEPLDALALLLIKYVTIAMFFCTFAYWSGVFPKLSTTFIIAPA